jgi:hypothetical protein
MRSADTPEVCAKLGLEELNPQTPNMQRVMDFVYDWTHDSGGNVAMLAPVRSPRGYDALLTKYDGQDGIGWEDYLNGLSISPPCAARLETTASSST